MDQLDEVEQELPVYTEVDPLHGMLTGVILQVTTRYSNEYAYDIHVEKIPNGSNNGNDEYELVGGYAVDVFFYLQALLNFTYVLRPDVKTIFSEEAVKNASIDIYLASYSVLPDRAKYLEPTFVTGQSKIFAFMDHTFEGDSGNQNLFLIPFTPRLWFCTGLLIAVFIMSFLILNQFERQDNNNSTGDMIFHCISLSLQKGSDFPSFHDSTRLAALVFSFAVVIIMTYYSGIMTSIFAVSRYSITNLESLINSNYKVMLEVGFDTNSSTILYMLKELGHIPIVGSLLRKSQQSNFVFTSFNDAIANVKKSPATYIIDEETGLETISQVFDGFPCTWSKIPVYNLEYPWSMYTKKGAIYQNGINLGIVRVRERGILRRIRHKWIHDPPVSCITGGVDFKGITYSQIQGALQILLIVILILSPGIFILEKCAVLIISCRKKRDNDRIFTRVYFKENDRLVTRVLFQENDKIFIRKTHFYN